MTSLQIIHKEFTRAVEQCSFGSSTHILNRIYFAWVASPTEATINSVLYSISPDNSKISQLAAFIKGHLETLKLDDLIPSYPTRAFKDDIVYFSCGSVEYTLTRDRAITLEWKYMDGNHDRQFLNKRIFDMLHQYHSGLCFSNRKELNFHSAVPPTTLKVLQENFKIEAELFASPLNCKLIDGGSELYYCSLFPKTDKYFGSFGSFWDFDPIYGGSFQCNPPFTEEIIYFMALRLIHLLEHKTAPLLFIVFVPNWVTPPTPGLELLDKTPWLTKFFIAKKGKHSYIGGNQHFNQTTTYTACHDTKVYFLQNQQGAERWPITKDDLTKVKLAMRN